MAGTAPRSIFAYWPVRTAYKLIYVGALLCKMPYWLALYALVPSARPHARWTALQTVLARLARYMVDTNSSMQTPVPRVLEPGKLKDRYRVVEPSASRYYQGPLLPPPPPPPPSGEEAAVVVPQLVGGTWYPRAVHSAASLPDDPHVVLHVHGGAFVIGDSRPAYSGFLCGALVQQAGADAVFSIDYRLSSPPECAPFPAGLQDVLTAYLFLLNKLHLPASAITLAGDSSGGNLVVGLLRYLAAHGWALGIPPPRNAVLVSPWVSLRGMPLGPPVTLHSHPHYASDYIPHSFVRWGAQTYLGHGRHDVDDPYVTPLGSPFATPVPIFVSAGTAEVLETDVTPFATQMARVEGNEVQLEYEQDAPHDTLLVGKLIGWEDSAKALATKIGVFMRKTATHESAVL
jgi:acetyl esterase/lipase